MKKFRGFKRVVCFLSALLLMAALAPALGEGSRGILYKVQNGNATVYLLGSIHVGNEEMYPFGAQIRQAMEASDTYVFECDTTSAEAMRVAREMMFFTDGTRLRDVISPELFRKLEAACKKAKRSLKTMDTMHPWAAMAELAMYVAAAEMGAENARNPVSQGVETMVRAFAAEKGARFGYLETVQGQLANMADMSAALQEYLLEEALVAILEPESVQGMDATMRHWPGWWAAGDSASFVENYRANYLSDNLTEGAAELLAEYHNTMVTLRNQTMADRVDSYLQGNDGHVYFITVGLLHLVLPEDSIVTNLRERGYQVKTLSER